MIIELHYFFLFRKQRLTIFSQKTKKATKDLIKNAQTFSINLLLLTYRVEEDSFVLQRLALELTDSIIKWLQKKLR